MKDLEKLNELIILYELYQGLLTAKQREYFELYFFDDYSLSEIARLKNVSRNAIYDSLIKITNALHKFENNLKLCYKQHRRDIIYQEFENINECTGLIKKLKKIDSD